MQWPSSSYEKVDNILKVDGPMHENMADFTCPIQDTVHEGESKLEDNGDDKLNHASQHVFDPNFDCISQDRDHETDDLGNRCQSAQNYIFLDSRDVKESNRMESDVKETDIEPLVVRDSALRQQETIPKMVRFNSNLVEEREIPADNLNDSLLLDDTLNETFDEFPSSLLPYALRGNVLGRTKVCIPD